MGAPPVIKSASQPPPLPASRPVPPRSPQVFFPAPQPRAEESTSWVGAVGAVFTIIFLLAVCIVGAVFIFRDAPSQRARANPPPQPKVYPLEAQPQTRSVPKPARAYPYSTNAARPAEPPWPASQWATMNDEQKKGAMEVLLGRLKSDSFALRRSGAEALGGLGADAREAIPQLETLTGDTNACVRHAAAYALGAIGSDSPATIEALARLLQDPDAHVRPFAATALQKVQPNSAAYAEYRRRLAENAPIPATATAGTYNDRAWQLVQQNKNPQIALSYARKAAQLAPDDVNIKDTLGWAYLRNDRYPEALETFSEVITGFRFEERGVASSWRGAMEVAQAPVDPPAWQEFVDKLARDANFRTSIRLNALQAEFHRRQGKLEKARDYWRQTGFLSETNWLILGPFNNLGGALAQNDSLPDHAAKPDLEKLHNGRRGPCRWERRDDGLADGYVDLKEIIGGATDWLGAYAWTTFEASAAVEAQLRVGSDDQVTLWLNGELVHKIPQSRTANIDQEQVPVKLKAGPNTLLVKCCNQTLDWGFYVRFTDDDLRPLPELNLEK